MNIDPRITEIRDCLYRVAVKAIIVHKNKVLLVRDDPDDRWSFPGGGIDYGETAKSALLRELEEELGVEQKLIFTDFRTIAITAGHVKEGIPRVNIYFSVNLNPRDIKHGKDVVELKWFDLKEFNVADFDQSNGDMTELFQIIQRLLS